MVPPSERTYLGLDLSTQQLKAVVVSDDLQILHETQVQFDNDLPEFRTHSGVCRGGDNKTVTAPTLMWVKALDMLLDKLRVCGVDFSKVVALSGTAQQHGSVWWATGAGKALKNLSSESFLHQQLAGYFSINDSPVWMDSSTTKQCQQLEAAVGGPEQLAALTGSRGYERFTGSQIAKIAQNKSVAYNNTERISLVSSFLCSLFLGDYAPIDWSDGSGMNLFDIHKKDWCDTLLEACAPNLRTKLGEPVPSYTNLGSISPYFVERFGFESTCRVIACTGDNPASLAGMQLQPGDMAVSLGTSDTIFLWLEEPHTLLEGHVLCNPVDKNAFMTLLCFKNGSLTRERLRNNCADESWQLFNELLESTPRGNFGNIGLYYDEQEILPFVIGDHRFNKANEKLSRFASKEVEVRALVEGQSIAKRAHVEEAGFILKSTSRILVTGGASANKCLLQVLSDVFNTPVYRLEIANTAMLGAAYQAKHGLLGGEATFSELTASLPPPTLVCSPYKDASQIYDPMVTRYRKIIEEIVKE
ncbi:hypothetical protein FOCC_FOCC008064 [Frankliniella occidentalis]|uniref:Xylulose kinase n=1 Tax=Frankliniella occidentalis TaxID=133901 RepID=A0A6J1SRF9_FRAOC|nr:xylulose kinase [Frankliniella occidentalis]KAE8745272.1 hypothetical protein FOCC_FOCC008064 [Frankliniella occidentalis]